MAINFDDSSWAKLEPAFYKHIQSYQTAAMSASQVNRCFSWCGFIMFYLFWFCLWRWEKNIEKGVKQKKKSTTFVFRWKKTVECRAAAMRHPGDGRVQYSGCFALHSLCRNFPALRGALQRDPAVLATARRAAAADPRLEKDDRYTQELVWLRPCLDECGTGTAWGVGTGRAMRATCQSANRKSPKVVTSQINSISLNFYNYHVSFFTSFCSHTLIVNMLLYSFWTLMLTLYFCCKLMFDVSAVWHRPWACFRTKKPNFTDLFHLVTLKANMIRTGFCVFCLGYLVGDLYQKIAKPGINGHFASSRSWTFS